MPDEYTAVSVPGKGRGARLDETLDVREEYGANDQHGAVQGTAVARHRVFAYEGPLFTIPETVVGRKPSRRPGPDATGGHTRPVHRLRAGRRRRGRARTVREPRANTATLAERVDLAGRFIEGVRRG
ncbi:hypothetical protein [Streptomyces sp. NPDC057877]|uniref:hypothetical protein n=1 Tax=Streptomyces sp. NPDC057877 TaxID=3346269 RepID=UPI00367DCF02